MEFQVGDLLRYQGMAASVNTARAIYALNWFDITPGFIYIAADLKLRVVDLGIMTASFYVGLALFQLVGGVLASRMGAKVVAFIGIMTLGISAILSGYSYNLTELAIFRFMAGVGSALFFSPGLSVLKNISPPESFGLQVGIYNGAFNLGAGVGAFGWVFVDRIVGWRLSLVVGGLLAVGIAVENALALRDVKEEKVRMEGITVRLAGIVWNRLLWLLSIGTIIVIFSETIIGQFIIFFGEKYLSFSSFQAGLVDGVFLILGFVGGVVGGHIISKTSRRKMFTYFILVVDGVLFMFIPFASSFYLLLVVVTALGLVVVSGFSILYTLAAEIIEDKTMTSFSLSFVNFIQLVLGSLSPLLFTEILAHSDYIDPWIILGAIGLAAVPLLVRVETRYFR